MSLARSVSLISVLWSAGAILGPNDVAHAQTEPYAWTLSTSPVDPLANTLPPSGTPTWVYLWLYSTNQGNPPCPTGMSAAILGLSPSPGGPVILAVQSVGQVVISGTPTCVVLQAGGCPTGPIVMAQIFIIPQPGNICFTECSIDASPPQLGTVDCSAPGLLPICWIGLDVGGGGCGMSGCFHGDGFGACCLPDGTCVPVGTYCECLDLGGVHQGAFTGCPNANCAPVGVDETSWGEVKGTYR